MTTTLNRHLESIFIALILCAATVTGYLIATYYSNPLFTQALLMLLVIPLAFTLSVEWLIWVALISVMMASSWRVPQSAIFYLRYGPMALLAFHGIAALANRQTDTRLIPKFLLLPMSALSLVALLSYFYAFSPLTSLQRATSLIFAVIGFLISLPIYLPTTEVRKQATYRFVFLCAVAVLVNLWSYLSGMVATTLIDSVGFFRVRGLFGNPNMLGALSMFTLFPLATWAVSAKSILMRGLLTVMTFAVIATLALSGSRASFVAAVAGFMVLVLATRASTRITITIAIMAVIGLFLMVLYPHFVDRIFYTGLSLRTNTWSLAIERGFQSPIYGHGFSTEEFLNEYDLYVEWYQGYIRGGHNEYIRTFVGLGFIGLSLFLATLAIFLFKISQYILPEVGEDTLWLKGLLAAVAAGLVHAIFEDGLLAMGGTIGFVFWYFAAIIAVEIQKQQIALQAKQDVIVKVQLPKVQAKAV